MSELILLDDVGRLDCRHLQAAPRKDVVQSPMRLRGLLKRCPFNGIEARAIGKGDAHRTTLGPYNTEMSCRAADVEPSRTLSASSRCYPASLLHQLSKANAGHILQFFVGPPPWRAVALNPGGHLCPGLEVQDLREPTGRRRRIGTYF
jgi:hypothetical protein